MKYIVGFSGGIDSTFVARQLKQQGHEVLLINIKNTKEKNKCCQLPKDLKKIADKLDLDLKIIDATKQFKKYIINDFIEKYSKARTPNPCIRCNKLVRFKILEKVRQKHNYDKIATGHYSDIAQIDNQNYLAISKDKYKDQTYMLYKISNLKNEQNQRILNFTDFPIKKYTKKQVREIIKKENIPTITDQESQNICFVPDDNYEKYIQNHSDKNFPKGPIYNTSGEQIGTHQGIIHYTIGQRKGLDIKTANKKLYVNQINPKNNSIVVGSNDQLLQNQISIKNYFLHSNLIDKKNLYAKIRYHNPLNPIETIEKKQNTLNLTFENNIRAPSPGQYCVLYTYQKDKTVLLGGGQIT